MAGKGGSTSLWNNSAFSGSYMPSPGPTLTNMTSPDADSFSLPPLQVPQLQFSLFQQGAYMHENQALQEHCGILEAQVTKLSIEHDTIQTMFHQLASSVHLDEAVESLSSKGTHLSLVAPSTSNTKQPTRETHPKVKFWAQDTFLDWAKRASAQGLHRGKIPYLEGENREQVPEATVKAIHKTLRGGWSELKSRKDSNNDSNDDSNDGDSLDTKGKKCKKMKHAKSKVPEKKAKFTLDVSIPPSLPPTPSIPPAVLPPPVLSPSLHLADSEHANIPTISTAEHPCPVEVSTPTTIIITEPSHSIEECEPLTTSHPMTPITQLSCPANTLAKKENAPPHATTTTSTPIKITVSNPISLLALAAAGMKIPPLPSNCIPIVSPNKVPVLSDEANSNLPKGKTIKAGSKIVKMHPGPTKNGRNLCTLWWLKQLKIVGMMEEFCAYYMNLTPEQ
ncbi:hypothetical protein BDR05DRAFT_994012 [Suillus weaverae]|nr:hypothetical protein BDR05DRAFT_994012 [Suillus weaverae]